MAASIAKGCNELLDTDRNYLDLEDNEFKERLVREAAKYMKEKKAIPYLLSKLKDEMGKDCKQVWNQFQDTTTKKLMCLLTANDLLKNVAITMRLSPVDWLFFDFILVHKKINVTNCDKLPQCINELYQSVTEHKVEHLVGDELADAWIRITLQYNKGGRQCSPMLLQLRWYQLKEMSRQQVYKPTLNQDSEKTKILHSVAIKYQKIITQPFPKWEALIKEKRIILPEQFLEVLNREKSWKGIVVCERWYLRINQEISNLDNKVVVNERKRVLNEKERLPNDKGLDNELNSNKYISKDKSTSLVATLRNDSAGDMVKRKSNLIDKNNIITDNVKRQRIESNTACSNRNTDPKLLKKPIVFTKKIECMKVFKHIQWNFVNDKRVIDNAILENNPNFKGISTKKDIDTTRKELYSSPNIYCTSTDGDYKQNTCERTYNSVTPTSLLLQKPKNCKYQPIQLCKNPDFNIKLKLLTPAFFSLARNRILLKECKPLTIDLNKEFEKKLINGTIYVKSDMIQGAKIKSNQIVATPIEKIGCILPLQDKNNIPTEESQASGQAMIRTLSERRKRINLPNIDQIPRFNESLLTAKVTPVRNETSDNNDIIPRQLDEMEPKELAESTIIHSTDVATIIKKEILESDPFYDKNVMHKELGKTRAGHGPKTGSKIKFEHF